MYGQATMAAATLQSVLCDEVILPPEWLPDDTTLIYDKKGNPIGERDFGDPDDEMLADCRDIYRYKALVLAYYNGKHQTGYKYVETTRLQRCYGVSILIHFGFTAKEGKSSATAKQFCAKLEAPQGIEGKEVVTSCRIVHGPKTCEDCYRCMHLDDGESSWKEDFNLTESEEVVPPVSDQYSHLLADGVTLSAKAKYRIPEMALALAHYNKKQHADYKLVDALPCCYSCDTEFVCHANFIAKENKSGACNKLFFAELKKRSDPSWDVTACLVIRGKTTAGCHVCSHHLGKRVIHPTHGFCFGLYPEGSS